MDHKVFLEVGVKNIKQRVIDNIQFFILVAIVLIFITLITIGVLSFGFYLSGSYVIAGFFALSVAVIQISVAVYYARAAFKDDMAYEDIAGSITTSVKRPLLARRKPFIRGAVAKELLCSRVQFTNVDKLISFAIDASKFTLFAQDNEDDGAYTLGALIIKDNQRFLTRLHYKPKLIKKLDQVKSIISISPVLIDNEEHIESIIHNPGLAYDEYGEGFWRFVLDRDEKWMPAG